PGLSVDTDEGADRIAEILYQFDKPDFVIIDTWSHIKGRIRENDNDETGIGASRIIDRIAQPRDCAVLVTHHMGRQKEDGCYKRRGAWALDDMAADLLCIGANRESRGEYIVRIEKQRHGRSVDFGYSVSTDPSDRTRIQLSVWEHRDDRIPDVNLST